MNKIVKNTLILTLITVIAGFLLGAVYEVTKTPIAQSQETAKKEAWQAVFSDVKLDDFKAEDVDQKAADKAVKIWVSMQRSTKSVRQVMQDMSSQQQTKTDLAAISRLQLVLRKTVRSTVYLFFLSARQQVLV